MANLIYGKIKKIRKWRENLFRSYLVMEWAQMLKDTRHILNNGRRGDILYLVLIIWMGRVIIQPLKMALSTFSVLKVN